MPDSDAAQRTGGPRARVGGPRVFKFRAGGALERQGGVPGRPARPHPTSARASDDSEKDASDPADGPPGPIAGSAGGAAGGTSRHRDGGHPARSDARLERRRAPQNLKRRLKKLPSESDHSDSSWAPVWWQGRRRRQASSCLPSGLRPRPPGGSPFGGDCGGRARAAWGGLSARAAAAAARAAATCQESVPGAAGRSPPDRWAGSRIAG
jgi:hypothetical protein